MYDHTKSSQLRRRGRNRIKTELISYVYQSAKFDGEIFRLLVYFILLFIDVRNFGPKVNKINKRAKKLKNLHQISQIGKRSFKLFHVHFRH